MNTKSAPPTAEDAITGNKAIDDQLTILVKSCLKSAMPTIVASLVKVLQNEKLGPSRAYVLSDVVGCFTADTMAPNMLRRRIAAADMTKAMGRITGKIRAEFARPLHDQFAGVETPSTEDEQEMAEATGL